MGRNVSRKDGGDIPISDSIQICRECRASKGHGRVAYKEKNRQAGERDREREKREETNISISQLWRTRASVGCMQSQCTASNIRMAARRIDSYLERFAHLSASKSALSLSLSLSLSLCPPRQSPRRIKPEM